MLQPTVLKSIASPLRRYFNPRFESLSSRLDALSTDVDAIARRVGADTRSPAGPELNAEAAAQIQQAQYLAQVDVTANNAISPPTTFDSLQCRAVSAAECRDERYLHWWRLMENVSVEEGLSRPGWIGAYNRKAWEFAFIVQAADQAGVLAAGRSAVGFGVGREPIPALLASRGLDVLATDQGAGTGTGEEWAETGQLMTGLDGLRRDHLISPSELGERVRVRDVDMNAVPDDLGTFDLVWSSCVIEHLGSPARGLDFILESCALLRPGGIAAHTTELELTVRNDTADYGNCAVYRVEDLQRFAERVADAGLEATFNFHVAMDSPEDRWVSLLHLDPPNWTDLAHLKLVIVDSVSTSYGIVIRKPE